MPTTEFILEKEMHKIILDFEIKSDHQTPPTRSYQVSTRKISCHLMDFAGLANHRLKMKENDRQIIEHCQRTKIQSEIEWR